MALDNYDPSTALTAYYPTRDERRPARLWATEKLLHDMAELGMVEFFEGPGTDPTVIPGYSASKLWLRVSSGVTPQPGEVRAYKGVGDPTLLASWPAAGPAFWNAYELQRAPEQYGAAGDGVADDTAAWQTCLDAAPLGARIVARGTYRITSTLTVTTPGLVLDLRGARFIATSLAYTTASFANGSVFRVMGTHILTTTLASSGVFGESALSLSSAAGVLAGDVIRLNSTQVLYDNQGTLAYHTDMNRITNVSGTTVTLETPLHMPLSIDGDTVTAWIVRPVADVQIIGGIFEGGGITEAMSNGFGRVAISAYGAVNFSVSDATINGFQGFAVQTDQCLDVTVSRCHITGIDNDVAIVENQNSGFYGVYFFRTRRGTVTECKMVRTRHACDAHEGYAITQSNNIAVDTWRAAFGSHEEVYDLLIANNQAQGCYNGAIVRAYTCEITGNIFQGIGRAINTAVMDDAYPGVGRLKISGNRLRTLSTSFAAGIDVLGNYSPLDISENEIVTLTIGVWLNAKKIENARIASNHIHLRGLTGASGIAYSSNNSFKNIAILGNTIVDYTNNAVRLDGTNDPSNPAQSIIVMGNTGFAKPENSNSGYVLPNVGYFGDGIILMNNIHLGDSSAAVSLCVGQEYRLASAPINQDNVGTQLGLTRPVIGTATSAAHTGKSTLLLGQQILRTTPGSGQPIAWLVSSAGTEGSIAGVTGSITNGSTTLTLSGNAADKVRLGAYITIAGAGTASANLNARVVAIAADFASCTIDTAASTTVSGAAVSLKNPTITALANL